MDGNLLKTVVAASSGNIDELKNFSTQLYKYYFDRKEATREAIEKSVAWIPPPLRGLFKPKLARAHEHEQVTDLKAIAEHERQLLSLYFGTMIQYTKLSAEKLVAAKAMIYTTELKILGEGLSARLTAYCSSKMEEILAVYETAIHNHSQRRARMMIEAEQSRNDEEYYTQLTSHISFLSQSFFATQTKLLEQFEETLNMRLESISNDHAPQPVYGGF
jgi:hypothetical protein